MYVDDLISGGPTVSKAKKLKCDALTIFSDAGFELHNWHSNVPELEESPHQCTNDSKDTYAKQQLGTNASEEESKLVRLEWDKVVDTLAVTFPKENADPTKKAILGKLARIYNPLGLVSPTTLQRKFIYQDACELKQALDTLTAWKRWERDLLENIAVTRTLAPYRNLSTQWNSMHLETRAGVASLQQCT